MFDCLHCVVLASKKLRLHHAQIHRLFDLAEVSRQIEFNGINGAIEVPRIGCVGDEPVYYWPHEALDLLNLERPNMADQIAPKHRSDGCADFFESTCNYWFAS